MASLLIVGIGGKLLGVDASTGKQRWEDGLKGGGFGEVALAATNDFVLASATGAKVFCFRYETGELLWTAATSASGRATIVIEKNRVYVAKGGELDCFGLDGKRVWTQPMPDKGLGRVAMGFPGNIVQADDPGNR